MRIRPERENGAERHPNRHDDGGSHGKGQRSPEPWPEAHHPDEQGEQGQEIARLHNLANPQSLRLQEDQRHEDERARNESSSRQFAHGGLLQPAIEQRPEHDRPDNRDERRHEGVVPAEVPTADNPLKQRGEVDEVREKQARTGMGVAHGRSRGGDDVDGRDRDVGDYRDQADGAKHDEPAGSAQRTFPAGDGERDEGRDDDVDARIDPRSDGHGRGHQGGSGEQQAPPVAPVAMSQKGDGEGPVAADADDRPRARVR